MSGTLPNGWTGMDSKTMPVMEFINWEYNSATAGLGAETAIFDLRVFPFSSGDNTLETAYNGEWNGSVTYKVVDISGPNRGFNSSPTPSAEIIQKEILALSHVTVNGAELDGDGVPVSTPKRLLKKGEKLFPDIVGSPVVHSISVRQESPSASDVWLLSFKTQKYQRSQSTQQKKPKVGSEPPDMRDTYPWEVQPKVEISVGSESYNIGTGYFFGTKSPSEISTAITQEGSGFAEIYTGSSVALEVIKNSAGDPFKSPPSMLVGVNTYTITAALEDDTSIASMYAEAILARKNVNIADFNFGANIGATSIPKGTALLSGFSITLSEHIDKREWLPNQLHPFSKTNGELKWSGDGYPTNDIAINNYRKILQATRILTYYNVRITFSTKEVGWGVAIPNKGYRSLETGKLDAIKGNDGSRSEERLMDENSIPIKEGINTFETKCLRLYSTFGADDSLKNLIDLLPWQTQTT